jgi:hypothetical protein
MLITVSLNSLQPQKLQVSINVYSNNFITTQHNKGTVKHSQIRNGNK